MRRLLSIFLLIPSLLLGADSYIGKVWITNTPTDGMTLTVNGDTRTWKTNATAITQISLNSAGSNGQNATNLFSHIANNMFLGPLNPSIVSNQVTLTGGAGVALAITVSNAYGFYTITTNATTSMQGVRVPISGEPVATARTNIASQVVAGVNSYATNRFELGKLPVGSTTNTATSAPFLTTSNANGVTRIETNSTKMALNTYSDNDGTGITNISLSSGVTGTLQVSKGGTGATSVSSNQVMVGNGTAPVGTVTGSTNQILHANGGSLAPTYGLVQLNSEVSGTLLVGNGGSGATSLSTNQILLGNGTAPVGVLPFGTTNYVLTGNGNGLLPTWNQVAAGNVHTSSNNVYDIGTSNTFRGTVYFGTTNGNAATTESFIATNSTLGTSFSIKLNNNVETIWVGPSGPTFYLNLRTSGNDWSIHNNRTGGNVIWRDSLGTLEVQSTSFGLSATALFKNNVNLTSGSSSANANTFNNGTTAYPNGQNFCSGGEIWPSAATGVATQGWVQTTFTGGIALSFVNTGTNYTSGTSEYYINFTGTTLATVTNFLPVGSAIIVPGKTYEVIDGQDKGGLTNIVIFPNGADTINGAASYTLNTNSVRTKVIYKGGGKWNATTIHP